MDRIRQTRLELSPNWILKDSVWICTADKWGLAFFTGGASPLTCPIFSCLMLRDPQSLLEPSGAPLLLKAPFISSGLLPRISEELFQLSLGRDWTTASLQTSCLVHGHSRTRTERPGCWRGPGSVSTWSRSLSGLMRELWIQGAAAGLQGFPGSSTFPPGLPSVCLWIAAALCWTPIGTNLNVNGTDFLIGLKM